MFSSSIAEGVTFCSLASTHFTFKPAGVLLCYISLLLSSEVTPTHATQYTLNPIHVQICFVLQVLLML